MLLRKGKVVMFARGDGGLVLPANQRLGRQRHLHASNQVWVMGVAPVLHQFCTARGLAELRGRETSQRAVSQQPFAGEKQGELRS